MKGKYAKRAEIRRDWNGLEDRAETAEHRATRLASELAELREKTGREIAALRRDLTETRKQRDEASSPRLADAETRIAKLMAYADDERREHQALKETHHRVTNRFHGYLRALGFSGTEAIEILCPSQRENDGWVDPYLVTEQQGVSQRSNLSTESALAIAKAKGNRKLTRSGLRQQLVEYLNNVESEAITWDDNPLSREEG